MSVLLPSLRGRSTAGTAGTAPPDIGARVAWWAADGSAGSMWTDVACTLPATVGQRVAAVKTNEGTIFSQTDGPQRPILEGASQNGLPGLTFARSRNDFLHTMDATFLAALRALTAVTVLLVWKVTVHSGIDTGIWFGRPGGSNLGRLYIQRYGGGDDWDAGRSGSVGSVATYHAAANLGAAHAVVHTFDGFGGSPNKNKVFVQAAGNTANANTDAADSSSSWTEGTLGARKANTGHDDFLGGTLYELMILDAAADAGEVSDLFTYAIAKWGLP